MPTIIDSLIVTLGLDSKDLDSKSGTGTKKLKDLETQSDKTEKSVKKIGTTSKKTSEGFSDLTRAAGGFLALIGGTLAVKAFISDFIEANAALNRLSQNLGIGVSTISAWSQATEQLGGSASGLQGTFDMLSKAQTDLKLTGQSSLIPYLSALGISLASVDGKARPVDDLLLNLADRFSHMDRTTANNMGRMMGIDQGTMNLLLLGRHELELTIKRQKESTAVTKAQAEEASKLQTQIAQTKQKFTALGNALVLQAAPAIEKILDLFLRLGDWVLRNSEVVGDFLKVLAVGLGAIALIAAPIELTTLAILALAAGIALLWQDYQTWKRGGESFIDWSKWEPGITAATNGIRALYEILKNTIPLLREFMEWGRAKLDGAGLGGANKASDGVRNWARGKLGLSTPASASISATAKAQAQRVSAKTGIPTDIIFAQWEHETGGFKNRGATSLNNFAGINVPGGKGQDYRSFKSADDFGDYYAYLMRSGGRYDAARSAKSPEDFAAALKAGGYYAGSQADYSKDMRAWMGMPGASGAAGGASGSSSDTSRTVTIGTLNIQTQATDAPGIAKDIQSAIGDYLFTSQANSGLAH